ncbi:hypothetical protein BJ741DRAFT_648471 [Chytriomyces cf. hyalinus JEL632]|nr:hypothetical protein BJ741DRAFT_648471 [Chytriomyces cf. hyalinus JEL632]
MLCPLLYFSIAAAVVHAQAPISLQVNFQALPACGQTCLTTAASKAQQASQLDFVTAVCRGAPLSAVLVETGSCVTTQCTNPADRASAGIALNNIAGQCSGSAPVSAPVSAVAQPTVSASQAPVATTAAAVWTGCIMSSGAYISITHPLTASTINGGDDFEIRWTIAGTLDPSFAAREVTFEIDDASTPNNAVKAPSGDLIGANVTVGSLRATYKMPGGVPTGRTYTIKSLVQDGGWVKLCFSPLFAVQARPGVVDPVVSTAAKSSSTAASSVPVATAAPTTTTTTAAKSGSEKMYGIKASTIVCIVFAMVLSF